MNAFYFAKKCVFVAIIVAGSTSLHGVLPSLGKLKTIATWGSSAIKFYNNGYTRFQERVHKLHDTRVKWGKRGIVIGSMVGLLRCLSTSLAIRYKNIFELDSLFK